MWASAGIETTVLKGRSIAQFYPTPNRRCSYDLDVFVPATGTDDGQWEKACKMLASKGVNLVYEVYKEVEFTYKDVYVECIDTLLLFVAIRTS